MEILKPSESNIDEIQDNSISTQEMISDARFRRQNLEKQVNCDLCSFKSSSKTLLEKHKNREHSDNENKSTQIKIYTSKRISCQHCTKKFNKNATFQKHMEKSHTVILENSSQHDLPKKADELPSRETRQRNMKTVTSALVPNN